MKSDINPFLTNNYISKIYFCDREKELEVLQRNAQNNINTTLISPRRLGKTGLIQRFFESISEKNKFETVYVDIYASRNLSDFIALLADGILKKFPERTSIGKQFLRLLKGFSTLLRFDEITGTPQVQFHYQTNKEKEYTLQKLLTFVDTQTKPVIIAIDEFQEIACYPEKNVEALLRTYIQQLKNTHFIFCGSRKHTLVEIFSSAKRPFFASTQFLHLEPLDRAIYKQFISSKFVEGKRSIDIESIEYLLDWTKGYTFYTQSVCNRLYNHKKIDISTTKIVCNDLLTENESTFLQYRKLITNKQWDFLVALAKEETVIAVYSNEFLKKYNLGTPSTTSRILKSLIEKELILETIGKNETEYCVYDIFFMRWLQRTYI